MSKQKADLHLLLEIDADEEVRNEVRLIHDRSFPGVPMPLFERCFDDTLRLFTGKYAGYQSCKTEYHDLRHTMTVLLATARMIHATVLDGRAVSPHIAELALLAAMMHDTGYIQGEGESGRGGQYTLVHVERSVEFFETYGKTLGLTRQDRERCGCMISATSLSINPESIPFPDEDTQLAAGLVATADLLGQLADRIYLEKLLFLYQEFREAGVLTFASELDLLTQTNAFYSTVRQRIDDTLGGLDHCLQLHFRERWGIGRDLYRDAIALNIQFLDSLVNKHREDYRNRLKRGGIVERIKHAEATAQGSEHS